MGCLPVKLGDERLVRVLKNLGLTLDAGLNGDLAAEGAALEQALDGRLALARSATRLWVTSFGAFKQKYPANRAFGRQRGYTHPRGWCV